MCFEFLYFNIYLEKWSEGEHVLKFGSWVSWLYLQVREIGIRQGFKVRGRNLNLHLWIFKSWQEWTYGPFISIITMSGRSIVLDTCPCRVQYFAWLSILYYTYFSENYRWVLVKRALLREAGMWNQSSLIKTQTEYMVPRVPQQLYQNKTFFKKTAVGNIKCQIEMFGKAVL